MYLICTSIYSCHSNKTSDHLNSNLTGEGKKKSKFDASMQQDLPSGSGPFLLVHHEIPTKCEGQ